MKVELTPEQMEKAVLIHAAAVEAQTEFWDRLGDLEEVLGFEVSGTDVLADLEYLIDEYNAEEDEEGETSR